jgi:Carboxypeptidase regulatory-like domain
MSRDGRTSLSRRASYEHAQPRSEFLAQARARPASSFFLSPSPVCQSAYRRALALGAAGAICVLGIFLLPSSAAAASDTASISGTVTSAHEGKPLEALEVCALKLDSEGNVESEGCAPTNADGNYTIGELPAGEYKIEFTGYVCLVETECFLRYVPQFYDGRQAFGLAKMVDLSEGEALTGIDASMLEGGSVSGTVRSNSIKKQPIEDAEVCAIQELEGVEFGLTCALTNADGNYTISGLAAESAYIAFTGEVCNPATETCAAVYKTQYYNDHPTPEGANTVAVGEGGTTAGISASLEELTPKTPVSTEAPRLSGTAAAGSTLHCSEGEWADNPTSLEYGWRRGGTLVAGQASSSYLVTSADEGQTITCEVTARNGAGSASATSNSLQVPGKTITTTSTTTSSTTSSSSTTGLTTATSATTSTSATSTSSTQALGSATASGVAQVKGGDAAIIIHCAGGGGCEGSLKLLASATEKHTVKRHGKPHVVSHVHNVVIGTATFHVPAGGTETLHVHLTSEGQKLVRDAGAKGLSVRLTGSDIKAAGLLLKEAHPPKSHHGASHKK